MNSEIESLRIRKNNNVLNLIKRRKEKWFSENGPCKKCASWENLEVHHVNPEEKAFSVRWNMKYEPLLIELKKCVPMCPSCHKELTIIQLRKPNLKRGISLAVRYGTPPKPFTHGTRAGYSFHRCRCEECRKAAREYSKKWREKPSSRIKTNLAQNAKHPSPKNGFLLGLPVSEGKKLTHGSKYCYHVKKCRCEICITAQKPRAKVCAEKARIYRAKQPKREKAPIVHGTYNCYCHHACRCDSCKNAAQIYRDKKREMAYAVKDVSQSS